MHYIDKKTRIILFALLLFFCCAQNLIIYSFGIMALKYCHVFSLIFLPMIFFKKKIRMPNKIILFFIIFVILHAVALSFDYSIAANLLNYIFGLYIVLIQVNIADDFSLDDWLNIIRKVAVIMLLWVIIKDYYERDAIISFINHPYGHPSISTIFGGGANLEATWLALMGFAFKKRGALIYNAICTVISAVYASRAGLIINALWIIWFLIRGFKKENILKYIFLVVILFSLLFIANKNGLFDYIFERFSMTGEDPGSVGRTNMWQYAGELIRTNPLGVGIGNSIKALERLTGVDYSEGNFHNVYMQMFIDLGWLGGLAYLSIVIGFVIKQFKNLFNNPLVAMLYVYAIVSLVQFKGGDSIIFYVLGAFLVSNKYINTIIEKLKIANARVIKYD